MLLRIESCRFAVEFFRNLPVVLSFHTLVMILTSEPLVLSSTIRLLKGTGEIWYR